jgi:hypothetical protein
MTKIEIWSREEYGRYKREERPWMDSRLNWDSDAGRIRGLLINHMEDNSSLSIVHVPVLWREILSFVRGSRAAGTGTIVDCTLGEGGHSELFLSTFPDLRVIAFRACS